MDIVDLLGKLDFPVWVAAFLLVRLDRSVQELRVSVVQLVEALRHDRKGE